MVLLGLLDPRFELLSQPFYFLTFFVSLNGHTSNGLFKEQPQLFQMFFRLQNLSILFEFTLLEIRFNKLQLSFCFFFFSFSVFQVLSSYLLQFLTDGIEKLVTHTFFKNMNKIAEIRQFYQFQIRKEEVSRRRADLRNLMVCLNQRKDNQCLICVHSWINQEAPAKLPSLLLELFQKHFVCKGHIQLFFSKILQTLEKDPYLIPSFLTKNNQESQAIYMRKVSLLFEIIVSQVLTHNIGVQEELALFFSATGNFISKMLDTAYQFNKSQDIDLEKNSNVKALSLKTILFIFEKYPLLFQQIFSEYPFVWLLQKVNDQKVSQLYQLLSKIYKESLSRPHQYSSFLPLLEEGISSQLRNITSKKQPIELEKELINLLLLLLNNNSIRNISTISEIANFCKNKLQDNSIINLTKYLFDFYHRQICEIEKECLRPIMTELHQKIIDIEKRLNAMDIQTKI